MKLAILTLFLTILSMPANSQSITKIDGSTVSHLQLDQQIEYLQQEANVHGLFVAVVDADSILYETTLGFSNIKDERQLSRSDGFYAASLSKPVFAFIVLKLVEAGVIDLDKPLVEYLDKDIDQYEFPETYEGYRDIVDDKRYEKITARMCLSHSSGFPNWRYLTNRGVRLDNKLAFEFDPGASYGYSGEGIQLLQFVVEQITKESLEVLADRYVFGPLGMDKTSFLWRPEFEGNYAVGHYKKKKTVARKKRKRPYAAGSMETTPADYIKFVQLMLDSSCLPDALYREMTSPQIAINSVQQFGPNRLKKTDANKGIDLSYGLGWGLYTTPHGGAVFKEGHLLGWEHYVVFYPEKNIGLVIMANSSNAESIFKELVRTVAGDEWMPWYWENFIPYDGK